MSRHNITYVGTNSKLIPMQYETMPDISSVKTVYSIVHITYKENLHAGTITKSEHLDKQYDNLNDAKKAIVDLFVQAVNTYARSFSSSFTATYDESRAKVHLVNADYDLMLIWAVTENLVIGG